MPPSDPLVGVLQDWLGVVIRRSMQSLFLYTKQNELSMSQIGALFQIHHGSSNISDVGEGLGISTAAASQMLEHFVQQGWAVRLEDPEDRRVKQLALTAKGRRIMQASLHARQGWLEDLVSRLSPTERDQVARAIKLVTDRAMQLETHPELVR